ncbi:MAG TPA: aminoglycoside phosphotransferase family protein [Mycobacteriales bacterium]|nr:aminoglycoside phosphotransferase family protein [Mycobacteriales bacterium]
MPTTSEPTQRQVNEINQAHGLHFSLRERCRDGTAGAWLVSDGAGHRAILKCGNDTAHRIARLPRLIERIRAAGYPTPPWLAAGVTADGTAYHLVEFVAGEPMSRSPLTPGAARQLIDVIERQAGLDPDPAQDWSRYARECAFGTGADDPRPMTRRLGPAGIGLIQGFDDLLAPYTGLPLPHDDLVHGDCNTSNVMHRDGQITGIVDAESIGSGTRALDYATLLREAIEKASGPEVIAAIRRAGQEVAGPGVFAVCAAAVAFDTVRAQYFLGREPAPGLLAGLHDLATALTG